MTVTIATVSLAAQESNLAICDTGGTLAPPRPAESFARLTVGFYKELRKRRMFDTYIPYIMFFQECDRCVLTGNAVNTLHLHRLPLEILDVFAFSVTDLNRLITLATNSCLFGSF